jgi:hypothetical protein
MAQLLRRDEMKAIPPHPRRVAVRILTLLDAMQGT